MIYRSNMKNKSYANRGMKLESLIDKTNKYYKENKIADIRKVPTPFKVLRTYEKNKGLKVGHLEKGEWVDYIGVKNGKMIAFDAKETKGKSLPLKNISNHQIDLFENYTINGAECFILISFSDLDRYFKMSYHMYLYFILENDRKSIPLSYLEEKCIEVFKVEELLNYL